MTEKPTQREQLRQERRQQILEAALAVFGQKGFHAANVSDVAAQAGVSQGTIYWYFESKDELLTAALLTLFEGIEEATLAVLEEHSTASGKLRALAESLVGFGDIAEGLFTLFLEFWASSPRRDEAAKVWVDLLVEYKTVVVGIIEEGVRNGEFKPVDAEGVVWAMMAAYDGLAAYSMLVPGLDLGSVSNAFVGTLLTGLEAGK
jgi:AcrR family transcriptional regulator